MTPVVSDDPSWWPYINAYRISSYFVVAASVGLMYDWVLTLGQEVELIWRKRWSLMTVLYLSARYLGILYAVVQILFNLPTMSVTNVMRVSVIHDQVNYNDRHRCWILYDILDWTNAVVFAILGVIMITRLNAIHQRSRKILIFLVVTFLAVNIFNGVVSVMYTIHISAEELILSGTHHCKIDYEGNILLLGITAWILFTAWEVLALCLAVWIALKHFREKRQHMVGGMIMDCFSALMKSHVLYFASSVAATCLEIGYVSPTISMNQTSLGTQIYAGFLRIFTVVQLFVLGPRLILSLREYNATVVADSDATTGMSSVAFQEHVDISTGSSV